MNKTTVKDPRIIFQYDAMDNLYLRFGGDLEKFSRYGFEYLDKVDGIDTVLWDVGYDSGYAIYPSKVMPENPFPPVSEWLADGVDLPAYLVDESHKRGRLAFWNFRVCDPDRLEGRNSPDVVCNPVKKAHPDWLLKSWSPRGFWDYSNPDVCAWRAEVIGELAENYAFDGFQIDFARHLPYLPVGSQRECCGQITAFMRLVRKYLDKAAKKWNKPVRLMARVHRHPSDTAEDGLDVKSWVENNLVDMLAIGSRSFEVDFGAWRVETGGKIPLYPTIDRIHYSDGYPFASLDIIRGVAERFYDQGADGLNLFNWYGITPESYRKLGCRPMDREVRCSTVEVAVLPELADSAKLTSGERIVPLERRGGYFWEEGCLNNNRHAQLPLRIPYTDETEITIRMPEAVEKAEHSRVAIVFSNILEGEKFSLKVNGVPAERPVIDRDICDEGIGAPAALKDDGYVVCPQVMNRMSFLLNSESALKAGENHLSLVRQPTDFIPPGCRSIYIEKVEVTFKTE